MPNLQDIDTSSYARMFLFKGIWGTGKTPAAASFPNVYIMDFDRRAVALKKMFPHKKDIYFDTFKNYPAFADKFDDLMSHCPYETVVIDSATNFVELVMDYFIKLRGGKSANETAKSEEKSKSKSKGAITLLQIDDYSAETRAVSELLINLKGLAEKGINVILTAHVITTSTTNLKGGTSVEKFLLTYGKKAAGKIPTLFDEIYHFTTQAPMIVGDAPSYFVNFESQGDDFARSSFHVPQSLDWTNKNFYELIKPYFGLVKESAMDTSLASNSHFDSMIGALVPNETSITTEESRIGDE